MSLIYSPREDSYLLSKTLKEQIPKLLKKNPNIKILELGSGSGIQLQSLKELGIKSSNILGTDLNKEAIKFCKNLGFKCIYSDLFSNVKSKFDIILFNPPYLPEDNLEDKESKIATTGGKNGSELINKFLKQAKDYLNKNGRIFLLTSSLTKKINWRNWKKKKVSEQKLFFEKIFV